MTHSGVFNPSANASIGLAIFKKGFMVRASVKQLEAPQGMVNLQVNSVQ